MKKKLLIAITIASSINCFAQNNPQVFYGGSGDGSNIQNYSQTSISTMFSGSIGDGFNGDSYSQQGGSSQFAGGNGDGWNTNNYSQASIGAMFTGGNGDGFMQNNYLQQGSNQQFLGGNGDGWSTNNYHQMHPDFAFRGGVGDGWASLYTPLAPLPITFLKFEADKRNETAYLNWQLAKDDEVRTFEVERSSNAVSFEKIGIVAQNAANNKKYEFTDERPFKGNNYYRIKVINKNGKEEYTGTRVVNFDDRKSDIVKIYPNPATNLVNIEFPSDYIQNENIVVNVYGINGAMVYQQKMQGNNLSIVTINTSNLAAGNYVVHIASNTQSTMGKFTVTK